MFVVSIVDAPENFRNAPHFNAQISESPCTKKIRVGELMEFFAVLNAKLLFLIFMIPHYDYVVPNHSCGGW